MYQDLFKYFLNEDTDHFSLLKKLTNKHKFNSYHKNLLASLKSNMPVNNDIYMPDKITCRILAVYDLVCANTLKSVNYYKNMLQEYARFTPQLDEDYIVQAAIGYKLNIAKSNKTTQKNDDGYRHLGNVYKLIGDTFINYKMFDYFPLVGKFYLEAIIQYNNIKLKSEEDGQLIVNCFSEIINHPALNGSLSLVFNGDIKRLQRILQERNMRITALELELAKTQADLNTLKYSLSSITPYSPEAAKISKKGIFSSSNSSVNGIMDKEFFENMKNSDCHFH